MTRALPPAVGSLDSSLAGPPRSLDLAAGGRSPVWHPYTQHGVMPPPIPIAGGEGSWLVTTDGRRIFDGISSWWVITHGHRHPRIVEEVKRQCDRLDQVIFAGFTHEPAETLARRLVEVAPNGLRHVFFSDSGSTAVEVAMKMALGFFLHRGGGRPRTGIVALEHAYHGDTVGTMSAGERGVFNRAYAPLLFEVRRIPFPRPDEERATLDALSDALRSEDVAALIVEPLLLGAGGMLMYPPWVLAELKRICERHGTLFIADEVLTGWGRTGTLFACERAGVSPDIMCVAKGLTAGFLPLAATLCRQEIFDAHYSTDRARALFHSSSFTANPIACSAAVANLDVWATEPVMERIAALERFQAERLEPFRNDRRFANVRQLGTIAALDVVSDDDGYLAAIGPRLYRAFLQRDVLLRPLGNTVYVMPPYSTKEEDLDRVYQAVVEAVSEAATGDEAP